MQDAFLLQLTDAVVLISGQVFVGKRSGLVNETVCLTNNQDNTRSARTGSFGNY
jgi:hypothetical protein